MSAKSILQHRRGVVGLLIAVVVVIAWIIQLPSEKHFSQELCDKIEIGMPLARVIEILGCPPGDYLTEPERFFPRMNCHFWEGEAWIDDFGEISVEFDKEDNVAKAWFTPFDPPRRRGWFERALDRVKTLLK
jgi:hypothetical protein